jgi:hypothetical protein
LSDTAEEIGVCDIVKMCLNMKTHLFEKRETLWDYTSVIKLMAGHKRQ